MLRRGIFAATVAAAALCFGVWGLRAEAQEAVFLIRHAEKSTETDDPPLTEAGRDRAARWAQMLSGAGIEAIYTSEAQRTRETGGIIAKALGLIPVARPATDTAGLVAAIAADHPTGRVLVVGHRETIPGIASELGYFDLIEISEGDFSRIFALILGADDPTLLDMTMP